jgi:hypothetical protein
MLSTCTLKRRTDRARKKGYTRRKASFWGDFSLAPLRACHAMWTDPPAGSMSQLVWRIMSEFRTSHRSISVSICLYPSQTLFIDPASDCQRSVIGLGQARLQRGLGRLLHSVIIALRWSHHWYRRDYDTAKELRTLFVEFKFVPKRLHQIKFSDTTISQRITKSILWTAQKNDA